MTRATEIAAGASHRSRMICRTLAHFTAALVFAVSASACSRASDTTATPSPASVMTPSPAATIASQTVARRAAPAASAAGAASASVDDQHESVSKNGVDASMGVATERDLDTIGLPMYPTITLPNTFLVKHVDKSSAAYRLQVSVKDGVDTVAAWYAKKLGPSFKSSHMNVLGGISSFSRKTPSSSESILLQAQQDENLHIPLTTITMTVTKRR